MRNARTRNHVQLLATEKRLRLAIDLVHSRFSNGNSLAVGFAVAVGASTSGVPAAPPPSAETLIGLALMLLLSSVSACLAKIGAGTGSAALSPSAATSMVVSAGATTGAGGIFVRKMNLSIASKHLLEHSAINPTANHTRLEHQDRISRAAGHGSKSMLCITGLASEAKRGKL
jgi:hypothetical protein